MEDFFHKAWNIAAVVIPEWFFDEHSRELDQIVLRSDTPEQAAQEMIDKYESFCDALSDYAE